jgi:hypothetical protein
VTACTFNDIQILVNSGMFVGFIGSVMSTANIQLNLNVFNNLAIKTLNQSAY